MAEPIDISIRDLLSLRRGLHSLDAVKSGKEGEITLLVFGPLTRRKLLRAYHAVEREALMHEEWERKTQKDLGVYDGMPINDENAKKMDAYKRAVVEALDEHVELSGLSRIKLDDLCYQPLPLNAKPHEKPALNPVQQSVLHALWPIIEEGETE